MLGQITEWFYKDLAGIEADPAAPGFKNIIVRPNPVGDLTWAQSSYNSPRGRIEVHWQRDPAAKTFTLRLKIPVNATATIWLPAKEDAPVLENGAPAAAQPGVKYIRREKDRALYQMASGEYEFTSWM